jgi:hypothetical protein
MGKHRERDESKEKTCPTCVSIAAGATLSVPSVGGLTHNVYAVVASGTSTVVYLYPNV